MAKVVWSYTSPALEVEIVRVVEIPVGNTAGFYRIEGRIQDPGPTGLSKWKPIPCKKTRRKIKIATQEALHLAQNWDITKGWFQEVDRLSPDAAEAKVEEEDFDLDQPETETPVYAARIRAIQMMLEFGSIQDRSTVYEGMLRQEGCIGGRELDPTPLNPTWRIQGFFEDTGLGIENQFLPDSTRGVILPRSLQGTLNIRDSAFEVKK